MEKLSNFYLSEIAFYDKDKEMLDTINKIASMSPIEATREVILYLGEAIADSIQKDDLQAVSFYALVLNSTIGGLDDDAAENNEILNEVEEIAGRLIYYAISKAY